MSRPTAPPPGLQARIDQLATEAAELTPYLKRMESSVERAKVVERELYATVNMYDENDDLQFDRAPGSLEISLLRADLHELGVTAIDA